MLLDSKFTFEIISKKTELISEFTNFVTKIIEFMVTWNQFWKI